MDLIARRLRVLRGRASDERGFTLVELLVGISVGGIVISAAITLVLMSMNASARVNDKVAGLGLGRVALAQLEARVRSSTCLAATEYAVNNTTNSSIATNSLLFAGPTELVYFADISNQNGATNVADSVGFKPYLRYIWVDNGATTEVAGRRGRLMEGWRIPTTSSVPYNYSVSEITGATNFVSWASPTVITSVPPTNTRMIARLVTNAVTGTTSTVTQPFFQYYDGPTAESIVTTATGGLAYTQLDDIDHIRINFRLLAESGEDGITVGAGPTRLDNRTVQFTDDVFLRNSSGDCSNY